MGDRIACLNPRCGRTAPADKYPMSVEVICGKCFRGLPTAIRERHRRHERRYRKAQRAYQRRSSKNMLPPSVEDRFGLTADAVLNASWERMRRYFQEPDKPEGLEAFLEEVGLA